jgi:hypothetical protein
MEDADGGMDSDAEGGTLNFSSFAAVDAGRTERRRGETFTTTAPRAQTAPEIAGPGLRALFSENQHVFSDKLKRRLRRNFVRENVQVPPRAGKRG